MLLLVSFVCLLHAESLIYEPFDKSAIGTRWFVSKNTRFNGTWALENRKADYSNGTIDGIVPKTPGERHAISMKKVVNASNTTFVLQFENKIQSTTFSCGGSYTKLLNEDFDPLDFNNNSPYVIMFGPDKCAGTNVIHFIYRTQNPLSKTWSEHKLITKIPGLYDNITHLYTLILRENDTFEIKVDNKVKTSGSLHNKTLFDTPFEPDLTIADPTDSKPSDWVDAEQIPDPNDTKPDDWNESAPPTIPDPKATKPEDWKTEEPLEIDDPQAVKPSNWNEEEDGPYHPARIDNPYCESHGCGPWTPPQIKNPLFKGKWKAKLIPNPLYKGKWKAREIANPYYYIPERTLHVVGPIYGIGFELVSPTEPQWFGNMYVGDSEEEALKIAKERWESVNVAEAAEIAAIAHAKAEAEKEKKAKEEAEKKEKADATGDEFNPDTQCKYP